MIEVAEQRRIDKNIVSENILKSQVLKDVEIQFTDMKSYSSCLEEKISQMIFIFNKV